MRTRQADSSYISGQLVFSILVLESQDADSLSEERYNQIYGKKMKAFFNKNKLYLVEVYGNAQSIYYIWEEEKNKAPKGKPKPPNSAI